MITGVALIMVAVIAAPLFSPFVVLQALATGLVSAVLLNTLVVRTLIVPATVTLLGKHVFWPVQSATPIREIRGSFPCPRRRPGRTIHAETEERGVQHGRGGVRVQDRLVG